jgi:hypothetical protein
VPVGLSRLGELAVGQSRASTREEQDDDGDGALQTHVRIPCWLIVADHVRQGCHLAVAALALRVE